MILAAHSCNDLSLVTESLDGCSKQSTASMDPCDVPGVAEDWLSKVPSPLGYLVDGLTMGTRVLNLELTPNDAGSERSDLVGDSLGFDKLAEGAETSKGESGTKT